LEDQVVEDVYYMLREVTDGDEKEMSAAIAQAIEMLDGIMSDDEGEDEEEDFE